ncbi:MAG: peptidoglycan-binding protein [Chthoniobacterales bacterium]|nr:peptidoglycan-binding protein [Chthoniobacterales bacterium]
MKRPIFVMKLGWLAFVLFCLTIVSTARADQTTSAVQQVLKDQGFYYGDVTGEKNADTTAAIRRYQIRNGLQITGQIDAETLRSLGVGAGKAAPAAPPARSAPAPAERNSEEEGQSAELPPERPPGNRARPWTPNDNGSPRPPGFGAGAAGVFGGTPYEQAPPDVQRHVIVGTQTLLARFGFYRNGIDGEFGPATVAALQAYQRRYGLVPDGRLTMETLSTLGLLPGQHGPRLLGRRPIFRRPVYRGQWIPE